MPLFRAQTLIAAFCFLCLQSPLAGDMLVNVVQSGDQRASAIGTSVDGDYVVVWQDDQDGNGFYDIFARGYFADGRERFGPVLVNTARQGQQLRPAVGVGWLGRFVVAWEDDRNNDGEANILMRGFNPDGSQWFSARQVNEDPGNHIHPDVSVGGYQDDVMIAWQADLSGYDEFDIWGQMYRSGYSRTTVNFRLGASSGQQIHPAVAIAPWHGAMVVWQDDTDGNGYFDIQGVNVLLDSDQPLWNAARPGWTFTVNSNRWGQQLLPDIDGFTFNHFAVVWQDDTDNNGYYDIKATRINLDGTKFMPDFVVNATRNGQQSIPKVAMDLNSGDFVVVWEDDNDDNGYYNVFARGFYASGNEKFSETMVHTGVIGQQLRPGVGISNAAGRTTFSWDNDPNNDGEYEIYAGQLGEVECDRASSLIIPDILDQKLNELEDAAPDLISAHLVDFLKQYNDYVNGANAHAADYVDFVSGAHMTEDQKQTDIMRSMRSVFKSDPREDFAIVDANGVAQQMGLPQNPKRHLKTVTYHLPGNCFAPSAVPEVILVEGNLEASATSFPISGKLREVGFSLSKRIPVNMNDIPNWRFEKVYDGQLYVGGDLAYKILNLKDGAAVFDWDELELAGQGTLELQLKRGNDAFTFAAGSTNLLTEIEPTRIRQHLAARGSMGGDLLGILNFIENVSGVELPTDASAEMTGTLVLDRYGDSQDVTVAYKDYSMDYGQFSDLANMAHLRTVAGPRLNSLIAGEEDGVLADAMAAAEGALDSVPDLDSFSPVSQDVVTTIDEISLRVRAENRRITALNLSFDAEIEACVELRYFTLALCSGPFGIPYPCPEAHTLAAVCRSAGVDVEIDLLNN